MNKQDPSDWDLITPEVIEQYKADWKKHGFPDLDYSFSNKMKHGNDINDAQHQPIAEQLLWVAAILEAVGDYKKTTVWFNDPCLECHDNQPCGHVIDGKPKRRGKTWHGEDWAECKYNHTYNWCAERWLASDDCKNVLDMLSIDYEYFRKQVGI